MTTLGFFQKLFITALFVAAILLALPALSGCNDQSGAAVQSADGTHELDVLWPPVRVRPGTLEFGEVRLKHPLTKSVNLVNLSDRDVQIREARTNCGCTTMDVVGLVVPANGSVEMPVNFDAEEPLGTRHATVTLLFAGWDNPIRFNVTAFVLPE